MKAEYDRELGLAASTTEDARIIEVDLFGEAEWILDSAGNPLLGRYNLNAESLPFHCPQADDVSNPFPQNSALFMDTERGHDTGNRCSCWIGWSTMLCGFKNELLGKHTAILGSTGSGKSEQLLPFFIVCMNTDLKRNMPIGSHKS